MGFFLCYFFSFFLVIFQKSANVTHLSIHREDSNCGQTANNYTQTGIEHQLILCLSRYQYISVNMFAVI